MDVDNRKNEEKHEEKKRDLVIEVRYAVALDAVA